MTAGEDDDGVDKIFASTKYEAAGPPAQEFMPWHRPRKQFVRRKQWVEQVKRMLQNLGPTGELRYLGLPGPDLLDVRMLYEEFCSERTLLFVGFGAAHQGPAAVHLNISMDEVRALDRVDPRSDVVIDDIRAVARENSLARRTAVESGPYDVINLDLCDNLLADGTDPGSIYDAIASLLALQNRRATPWLLLLTTRVDRPTVSEEVLERFDEMLLRNLSDCQAFASAYCALLGVDEALPGESTSLAGCEDENWLSVFTVALCKWLLHQAVAHETKVELKSTLSYRVAPGEGPDDLVSLALLFSPQVVPAPDITGVATQGVRIDECSWAAPIPGRVGQRKRVDQILAGDANLKNGLVAETRSLLELARYLPSDYDAWIDSLDQ